ncbi:MAG TPA: heparin lyase I family protein [Polyangia bacterium]
MKNLAVARLSSFGLAFLAIAVVPRGARATVVWTATMEKGDLSEWNGQNNPTKKLADGTTRQNIEVLGEKVHSGAKAVKITLHPDDTFGQYVQDRVDVGHNTTLTGEGKDSYLAGYYYLAEDAKTRDEIAFYETNVSYRNWMDIWVEPKTGGGTTIKLGIESNGAILGSVLVWTGEITPAQWHQLALHVHWSNDAQKGIVDFWIDGKQVVTGYKHNTRFDTNSLFFETGLHRVMPQPFVETLYMDDFIEADSLADIDLGAPPLGDGGTTDAGGGTDAGTAGGDASAGTGGVSGGGGAIGGTGGVSGGGGASGSGSGGAPMKSGTGGTGSGGATGTGSAGATGSGGNASPGRSSSGCTVAADQPAPLARRTAGLFAVGTLWLAARRRRSRR